MIDPEERAEMIMARIVEEFNIRDEGLGRIESMQDFISDQFNEHEESEKNE